MEVSIDEQIFRECPSFQTCSVNACPLDPLYGKRSTSSRDREQRCKTHRATRLAIAARYPADVLPTGGVLHAEIAKDKRRAEGKARWEALSPEERAQKLAKLVPFAAKRDSAGRS